MATKTTTRFEELLPVRRVTLLLLWNLAFEAILPEICGDRFDLIGAVTIGFDGISAVTIACEAPKGGHLSSRTKGLRVSQPDWNPLLA